ncbi:MAG TPA: TolC family protein [Vicinamibacterales bacterium]|nr:TolC family protein [Vicinamibacterales bacterium]
MLFSRLALIVGLLAAASSAVTAQGPPGGSLTLQAALDRALAANPTITAARLRGPIDLAGLAVARERLNPEASIEFQKETPKESYGFSVPLELGGKRSKRIAVGEATVRAGEAEIAVVIAQIRNDVRRAYFGLLVAETRQSLMQEIRDIAIRARDAAQQRFDAGGAPRLEVMQGELALASADNDVAAARGEADGARAELNALLAQPLDTPITLSSAFDSGTSLTREAALALAHDANTELRVIDRQIETQRARLALAGALRNPDLIPSAALTHGAAPEFDYGWRAGVAIAIPLFTTHRAGVELEQSTLDQLSAQRQASLSRIDALVASAAVLAQTRRQLYLRYRDEIIPLAQQVEQVAQDSYQLGQTGIVSLLQALQSSRDVRLRSIDAASQFQNSVADLERAIGAPLP